MAHDDHDTKLLVRQVLFSKSFLKREDLTHTINTSRLDSQPSTNSTRARNQLDHLLPIVNDALRQVFGYEVTDTLRAHSSTPLPSSAAGNASLAARKQSLQRANSQPTSAQKRYLKTNILSPQVRAKLRPLYMESTATQMYNGSAHDLSADCLVSMVTVPHECQKFILLSMLAFNRYTITRSELQDHVNTIGFDDLVNNLGQLLDELVHDKYLQVSKRENEQGMLDLVYEWTSRSFLELPQDDLVAILSQVFPKEPELEQKLQQSIKL